MKQLPLKIYLIMRYFVYLLWEIFISNLRVAHDVLTPHGFAKPGVIAIPLSCKKDLEITIFAIIISLTPGTLALDVSSDRKKLFIHAMFMSDKEILVKEIKDHFELPLLRILR